MPEPCPAPNDVLRAWRIAASLTQRQMAEALNHTDTAKREHLFFDVKHIADWESGRTQWPRPASRHALHALITHEPASLGFTSPHCQASRHG